MKENIDYKTPFATIEQVEEYKSEIHELCGEIKKDLIIISLALSFVAGATTMVLIETIAKLFS